ncbi:uncharacterized protein LOC116418323 [Nasonia vitripennis]|uniref:Uncharacterized protein n=1 Tax=Nasonia vitripennis TaxID=7425 RepID=A0A7M7QLC8_NASVI|nr:uncharacterized protein LOC116418323 [Nasonia vitripennis]
MNSSVTLAVTSFTVAFCPNNIGRNHPEALLHSQTLKFRSGQKTFNVEQLSDMSLSKLIQLFAVFKADELKRHYSYTCTLVSGCNKKYSSFASEDKAKTSMMKHIDNHLKSLKKNSENSAEIKNKSLSFLSSSEKEPSFNSVLNPIKLESNGSLDKKENQMESPETDDCLDLEDDKNVTKQSKGPARKRLRLEECEDNNSDECRLQRNENGGGKDDDQKAAVTKMTTRKSVKLKKIKDDSIESLNDSSTSRSSNGRCADQSVEDTEYPYCMFCKKQQSQLIRHAKKTQQSHVHEGVPQRNKRSNEK